MTLVHLPLKIPPWIAKAQRVPPLHRPAQSLRAETQSDESAGADRLDRACLSPVGRAGCLRGWVEEGSFPALLGSWSEPWFTLLTPGLFAFFSTTPLPFLSPLAAARRIREQRPKTGTYRRPYRPVAQEG